MNALMKKVLELAGDSSAIFAMVFLTLVPFIGITTVVFFVVSEFLLSLGVPILFAPPLAGVAGVLLALKSRLVFVPEVAQYYCGKTMEVLNHHHATVMAFFVTGFILARTNYWLWADCFFAGLFAVALLFGFVFWRLSFPDRVQLVQQWEDIG